MDTIRTDGCVLFNPNAGSAHDADALHVAVEAASGFTLHETKSAADTRRLAASRAREGCGVVVAAGGDGTINEVVNGLAEAGADGVPPAAVTLGIVPLGTGNDLARTLCLPEEPALAFELARKGAARALDLIHVDAPEGQALAINVCAGGFSGSLDEVLTEELKRTWGPLAYLVGTAQALPDLDGYSVRLAWDDGPEEPADAFNIVVANGRTAAGGKPAAPRANPEDGLLDVVVVRQCSGPELAGLAARVLAGDYLDDERVLYRRARRLRVVAEPGMWFNVDGELLTKEPATFTALPGALRVVVGPSYQPEPA